LSKDGKHIASIRGRQITSIICNVLTKIARKFHAVIPNNQRKKDILIIIINTVLSKDFTTRSSPNKNPQQSKSNVRTRPSSMKSDNAFFRIMNTINCEEGRILFMKTRE
jgi:hypothetical protein